MKKKVLTIGLLSVSLLAGGAICLANLSSNGFVNYLVNADEDQYTLTINKDTVKYGFAGYYVSTSKGNTIYLNNHNSVMFDTEDAEDQTLLEDGDLCCLRGNGAGFGLSSTLQNVSTVKTTFTFSNPEGNDLGLFNTVSDSSYENEVEITEQSGVSVTPAQCDNGYIHYWFTNVIDGDYTLHIKSIVITYTCL